MVCQKFFLFLQFCVSSVQVQTKRPWNYCMYGCNKVVLDCCFSNMPFENSPNSGLRTLSRGTKRKLWRGKLFSLTSHFHSVTPEKRLSWSQLTYEVIIPGGRRQNQRYNPLESYSFIAHTKNTFHCSWKLKIVFVCLYTNIHWGGG